MEEIYRYAADHSSRASEALAWLEKQTNIRTNHARMLSGSVQGELLRLTVLMSVASLQYLGVLSVLLVPDVQTLVFMLVRCMHILMFP